MMNLSNKKIKIIGAKTVGPNHRQKKMPCQDFFAYKKNKSKFIAVVSDGAGSAKFGSIGAKIICQTVCDILSNSDFDDIKKDVVFAIEAAREKICNHRLNKTKSEKNLMNFAATIIGVFYNKDKGVFFHIGDGAAIAFLQDSYKISEPKNGVFSCETFFYTMDDWENNLQFMTFENAHQICLMTDGVTRFALRNNVDIEKKFINPVLDFLNKEKNQKRAKAALLNTLNSKQAQKISSDDKTFVWIRL